MASISDIRVALDTHEPECRVVGDKRQASVALVLRDHGRGPEVLFIERAHRVGDPWSGHMAFPGGRVDATDSGAQHAAERETMEEVGLSLAAAEVLGRLDDLEGHAAAAPGMVISAFVYSLTIGHAQELEPNHEVEEAFWFPVSDLLDDQRHVDHSHTRVEGVTFPGILVGEPERHVVWGLTYRFLEIFLELIGTALPDRWDGYRPGRSGPIPKA